MKKEKSLECLIASVLNMQESDIDDHVGLGMDNWDSMRHLLLISEVEQYYKIFFETEDIFKLISVVEIKHALNKMGIDV